MFEDIVQRGKQQARLPFGLTPGQTSELQRAAAILAGVEESCADERLSFTLNNMLDVLHRITAAAEHLRRQRAAAKKSRD
jgi:hypothetical protein